MQHETLLNLCPKFFFHKLDKTNHIWETMIILIVCFNSVVINQERSFDYIWRGCREYTQPSETYSLK